ncbi:MAG: recombinase family protein, partial [Christensenellaceae bacterium]
SIDLNILDGKCIAPKAPFGYVKAFDDCHKLMIVPQAAAVVKEIFAMAERNIGITEIVRRLNLAHIPTPSCTQQEDIEPTDNTWNSRTVKYILTNRTYTGDLQQGKDDVVVENTHEALVSREVFSKIQEKFQAAGSTASTASKSIADNPLRGKVICVSCGSKMQRRKGRGNVDWYSFTCITNNRKGCGCSTGMYIREPEILNAVKSEAAKKLGKSVHLGTDMATIIKNQVAEIIIHKGGQIDVRFND